PVSPLDALGYQHSTRSSPLMSFSQASSWSERCVRIGEDLLPKSSLITSPPM
ncbi:hypothetical protein HAX54_012203, partial [Datura stramonium]|nr:hypothetical protein [Datura stramonium]